jgi:hypothetical protein
MVSLCEGLAALEERPRHLLQLPLLDVLHKEKPQNFEKCDLNLKVNEKLIKTLKV